ncbi:MAG: hypothetical protein PHH13_00975 [Candidatus Peribacteraceae bacterium]|nr:hypothetical protein [Candidatus Peribacteraceae bacterium]
MTLLSPDIEVTLKTENTRAVIEGKTAVSFRTFVMLILQRKILPLFKQWGETPIIIHSELLTSIASAAQDSQENRTHLILVTLGVGTLFGVFCFAVVQLALQPFYGTLGRTELFIVAGGLLFLSLLASILTRVHRGSRGQKVADSMEKIAHLLSK